MNLFCAKDMLLEDILGREGDRASERAVPAIHSESLNTF